MSIQSITSGAAAMDPNLARMANTPAGAGQRAAPEAAQTTGTRASSDTQSAKDAAPAPAGELPTREALLQAVEEVRAAIAPVAQNLRFSIDDDTGRTIVKVVDAQTDEVIRQMPSEEVLAASKALDKLKGVLIQQTA